MTNNTEPSSRASSKQTVTGDVPETAHPPTFIAQQHAEQRQVADRFVGDLLRGPLTDHVADRRRQRGAQGKNRRQYQLLDMGDLLDAGPKPHVPH